MLRRRLVGPRRERKPAALGESAVASPSHRYLCTFVRQSVVKTGSHVQNEESSYRPSFSQSAPNPAAPPAPPSHFPTPPALGAGTIAGGGSTLFARILIVGAHIPPTARWWFAGGVWFALSCVAAAQATDGSGYSDETESSDDHDDHAQDLTATSTPSNVPTWSPTSSRARAPPPTKLPTTPALNVGPTAEPTGINGYGVSYRTPDSYARGDYGGLEIYPENWLPGAGMFVEDETDCVVSRLDDEVGVLRCPSDICRRDHSLKTITTKPYPTRFRRVPFSCMLCVLCCNLVHHPSCTLFWRRHC